MPEPGLAPAAFLSYAHDDDELGEISRFRARLEFEVGRHLGRKFPIFFDRRDLGWGQQWKTRIRNVLSEATFLIPVLTPMFFSSPECREEVETFMRRERELGRDDLILPVYYIESPLLDEPGARERDPLALALSRYQYADWRELRHDARLESTSVSIAMADLARRLRDAVIRVERKLRDDDGPLLPSAAPAQARPADPERDDRPGHPDPGADRSAPAPLEVQDAARGRSSRTPEASPSGRRKFGPAPGGKVVPLTAEASHPERGERGVSAARGAVRNPGRARWPGAGFLIAAALVLGAVQISRLTPTGGLIFLHLWAFPPLQAELPCPPPRAGEMPDFSGSYAPVPLAALWTTMTAVTAAGVVLLVLLCYLAPRKSLSPAFVRGWYRWLSLAALFAGFVPLAMAKLVAVRALAGSCSTEPRSFFVHLPLDLVVSRALAGTLWGAAAFAAVSLIATRLIAQGPWAGGFYHYRGCPWPRWTPREW